LAVAVQFFLIVQLVWQLHLESMTFGRVMYLAFAGFLVHHYLPLRFRRAFFALLSLAATVAVIENVPGFTLIAIGLALVGICHLPVAFGLRVALLVATGGGLAVARANADSFPALHSMWPILGSMFVFRVMVYMYDLKHKSAPFGLWNSVAYFFMLPNVCFPLFPVVDYKTFCTTYYNEDALRVYQTGIKWMFRGVVQLLLYRVVYHFGLLNIADVTDAKDVAEFMVATYLLYLHVSGQFHLIVGLLHLFGFNLPETHHLYLLASSFTDFWRRINIYWKDFIMKLFFYPAFFALRGRGTLWAITWATIAAFFATWVLHSWQWFWFRGTFLISWQDVSFWCILAVLVLVNALREATSVRRRTLSKPRFDVRARLSQGLKTVGTFVVICLLWTMWSSQSLAELQVLAESALRITWGDVAIIAAGLAVIFSAAILLGSSARESSQAASTAPENRAPFHFWGSAATVAAAAASLLILVSLGQYMPPNSARLLATLSQDQLNAGDIDWQRRGYYEELDLVRAHFNVWRGAGGREKPAGWTDEDRLFRGREDFLWREMVPSASGILCGVPAQINRWGMRDREYEKQKPPNTFRIVLLGSSHEVGSGVRDDESFENLVEDRLNRESGSRTGLRYEILNLSVGGYGVYRKLLHLEEHGFEFGPDAVIFSVCAGDRMFDVSHLSRALQYNWNLPYPYLKSLCQQARVHGQMDGLIIEHRLQPYVPEMFEWAFHRLADECSRRRIPVFMLYRPAVIDTANVESARRTEMLQWTGRAGIATLDLSSAFDTVEDRNTLVLAPWDDHTNAAGHRLLANKLYEELAPRLERLIPKPRTAASEQIE
jgi:hypothetical protein